MKLTFLIAGAMALGFVGTASAKPGNGRAMGLAIGPASIGPQGPGYRNLTGYGAGGCPPGLARKAVPCMPPGQARKLYGIGDRLPPGAGSPISYGALPRSVRSRYQSSLSPHSRYVSTNGYVYRVTPTTRVVQGVVRR